MMLLIILVYTALVLVLAKGLAGSKKSRKKFTGRGEDFE